MYDRPGRNRSIIILYEIFSAHHIDGIYNDIIVYPQYHTGSLSKHCIK